eukprot:m.15289 g.15289  ORF g.15289 m.15289 type:complete len:348 (-) comp4896_c0_seq1:42-1085(-)
MDLEQRGGGGPTAAVVASTAVKTEVVSPVGAPEELSHVASPDTNSRKRPPHEQDARGSGRAGKVARSEGFSGGTPTSPATPGASAPGRDDHDAAMLLAGLASGPTSAGRVKTQWVEPTPTQHGTSKTEPSAEEGEKRNPLSLKSAADAVRTAQESRAKQEKRMAEVDEGWAVVSCLDHKDDYELAINSNPKSRSIKLLRHLRSPDSFKPPKSYKGSLVYRILVIDNTIKLVGWLLPRAQQIIIAKLEVVHQCTRDDGRFVRWKHPRFVISRQIEISTREMGQEVANRVWADFVAEVGAGREVTGNDAVNLLADEIVENSGCFYYGPSTEMLTVVADADGSLAYAHVE